MSFLITQPPFRHKQYCQAKEKNKFEAKHLIMIFTYKKGDFYKLKKNTALTYAAFI